MAMEEDPIGVGDVHPIAVGIGITEGGLRVVIIETPIEIHGDPGRIHRGRLVLDATEAATLATAINVCMSSIGDPVGDADLQAKIDKEKTKRAADQARKRLDAKAAEQHDKHSLN